VSELRRALRHLYDWTLLRSSPLIQLFDGNEPEKASLALQDALRSAIEALKPEADVPSRAKSWRTYGLLYSRYVEQFTQQEVANEMGLSVRHIRREDHDALHRLASYLWHHYELAEKWKHGELAQSIPTGENAPAVTQVSSPEQELEWLEESVSSEAVSVQDLIRDVLDIVHSLAQAPQVHVEWSTLENLPELLVPLTLFRQALLGALTSVIDGTSSKPISIRAQADGSLIFVDILVEGKVSSSESAGLETEQLAMARQLVYISGGSLDVIGVRERERTLVIRVSAPAGERIPVLVIDDNADTLRLLQRYLSNSRYRFLGTSDPAQALELAETHAPRVIVLDVMLPGTDGWQLLGHLHQHPETSHIPTVVCTILPQEQLALDLGASGFIRKPVSRHAFLTVLNRQLASPSIAPG
jgi:CheY-like chemotaxis protein